MCIVGAFVRFAWLDLVGLSAAIFRPASVPGHNDPLEALPSSPEGHDKTLLKNIVLIFQMIDECSSYNR